MISFCFKNNAANNLFDYLFEADCLYYSRDAVQKIQKLVPFKIFDIGASGS